MKKFIILFLLILLGSSLFSQSTINPDTVCIGTTNTPYSINPVPVTGTLQWTVAAPGVLVSGQGTANIIVNWGSAPVGLINNGVTVTLTGTSCPVLPITLNVEIIDPIIVPVLLATMCTGDPCVNLVVGPVTATGTWSGTGVVGNQFCPTVSGVGTFPLTFTGTNYGCTVTTTLSATVSGTITLGNITH